MKINQVIKFKLDGVRDGEGLVKYIATDAVDVELTKPCKEFPVGSRIIVSLNEIVHDRPILITIPKNLLENLLENTQELHTQNKWREGTTKGNAEYLKNLEDDMKNVQELLKGNP